MAKINSNYLSALVVLGSIAFTTMPAVAASIMSKTQIKSEIIDRAFAYKGVENGQRKQGRIFYESTGRVRILTQQGVRDGGSWKVDRNGKFCTRITLGRDNQLKCFSILNGKTENTRPITDMLSIRLKTAGLVVADRPGPM